MIDPQVQDIIQVLCKNPKARTEADKLKVLPMLKKIEFFAQWNIPVENNLINALTIEKASAGQILFEIHSHGDKFYLILHGKVGIYVPM